MSDAPYLIGLELRARGILEDIKEALSEEHANRETKTYLNTCAFALDSFIRYLERDTGPAI